jgi:hypothetical protein
MPLLLQFLLSSMPSTLSKISFVFKTQVKWLPLREGFLTLPPKEHFSLC